MFYIRPTLCVYYSERWAAHSTAPLCAQAPGMHSGTWRHRAHMGSTLLGLPESILRDSISSLIAGQYGEDPRFKLVK